MAAPDAGAGAVEQHVGGDAADADHLHCHSGAVADWPGHAVLRFDEVLDLAARPSRLHRSSRRPLRGRPAIALKRRHLGCRGCRGRTRLPSNR